jgi:dUTP pyrophosphatase
MRKFEKISYAQFQKDLSEKIDMEKIYNDLKLPKRGTSNSAGYDFCAPYDFVLVPGEIIKIFTGVKATMESDEFLMVIVRSSIGLKYNVRLCNQVGIIDSDYYNNDQNEGHICLALQNHGQKDWVIKKGDRVAQGIFVKYMITEEVDDVLNKRTGGIGSTNKGGNNNE